MLSHARPKSFWQVHRVVEMTADLAEVVLPWVETSAEIADPQLFQLWDDGRQLAADWQRRIDLLEATPSLSLSLEHDLLLTALTQEVLVVEMPLRLVATVGATMDRQRQRPDYRPIFEQVLFSLQHIRRQLLTRVLQAGDRHAALDRYRRRCERWTDLLIGPCVVRFGTALYTHDARRSWEFGEDLLADTALDLSQYFVRPSLLAAFRGSVGQSPIQSESGADFLQSLLSIIPDSLRTDRLNRWRAARVVIPESEPLPSTTDAAEDHESPSWSLLDRCLKIAESRRKKDN